MMVMKGYGNEPCRGDPCGLPKLCAKPVGDRKGLPYNECYSGFAKMPKRFYPRLFFYIAVSEIKRFMYMLK